MKLKTALGMLYRINNGVRIDTVVNKTGDKLVLGIIPYEDDCTIGFRRVLWYEAMNAEVVRLEPISEDWIKLVIDL